MMRVLCAMALIALGAAPAAATVFTVNNTNDSGAGSLRGAIQAANNDVSGPHRIVFNIAGAGVHTIHLLSSLDSATNPVAIDGTTQPGYNPNGGGPLIEIDGTGATFAFVFFASNSSVKGVTFNRFPQTALEVFADACTVSACYVGTNAAGSAAAANGLVGVYVSGNNVVVGGRLPSQRNVISGNAIGVSFTSSSMSDTLMGNYIGTDATGTLALGNTNYGVTTAGASYLLIDNNVISGSAFDGIRVNGSVPDSASGVRIYRNLIGTDASGRNKLPNQQVGVRVECWYTKIGGIGRGNVISGNGQNGIYVNGDGGLSSLNEILGNKVGVTLDGSLPLGNGGDGIFLDASQGNVVGVSRADGSGNLIAANAGYGVETYGLNAVDNFIRGNAIGTSFNGALDLGNALSGISIGGDRTTIGGLGALGNVIAHNDAGVYVGSVQNPVQGNAIFENHNGLGIDLLNPTQGITLNDSLDADDGSNHLQNFPVITAVSQVGSQVRLQGRLASQPNSNYTIDFYSNRQCSPTGYGAGEAWLGQTTVATNGLGSTTFDKSFPLTSTVGFVFTCTATDSVTATPSTSEFSPCAPLTPAPTAAPPPGASAFAFAAPLPSPARLSTSLTFTLPAASHVSLRAYDVSGRMVAELVSGVLEAGPHTIPWVVEDVRAGVYFCRLSAQSVETEGEPESATRSVIVVH